jgi:hypothetical protein
MTTPPDKTKRWRPRFSVRTLVVVVTLVCAYAACWGPTKRQGVADINGLWPKGASTAQDASPVLPLLIKGDENRPGVGGMGGYSPPQTIRRYYFWFFGYVAKLPYERELD